jgi:hypothetical protein
LFVCLPKFSCGINERHLKFKKYYPALNFFLLYLTTEKNILHCGIHRRRFVCGGGYNRRKTVPVWDITEKKPPSLWDSTEENSSNILKLLCGVSHTRGKPLL